MKFFDASTRDKFNAQAAVLRELRARADGCGVRFVVVGALARDLLIQGVLGSEPSRATADIDIAVSVDSWDDMARLTEGLSRTGGSMHTFTVSGIQLDIIPFHGVETPSRTIVWPDDHVMDVLGFEEALATAVVVRLPHVEVHVASLPAQVVLKLLAWQDRHLEDRRDAIDLRSIIDAYSQGEYHDELFAAHEDLLTAYDFEVLMAGADRLGYEALTMMEREGADQVTDLLATQCSADGQLPAQMGGLVRRNRDLLTAVLAGMRRCQQQRG